MVNILDASEERLPLGANSDTELDIQLVVQIYNCICTSIAGWSEATAAKWLSLHFETLINIEIIQDGKRQHTTKNAS